MMKGKRHFFTLLEVIVSMAVFAVMMLGLMQFFTSAQKLWTTTSGNSSSSEEIKVANTSISTDLANIYYEDPTPTHVAFHKRFIFADSKEAKTTDEEFNAIALATMRTPKTHKDAKTPLTAVFYRQKGHLLEMRTIADCQLPSGTWLNGYFESAEAAKNNNILKKYLEEKKDDPNADVSRYVVTTDATEIDGSKSWELLAENVLKFQVKFYKASAEYDKALEPLKKEELDNGTFPYMVQFVLIYTDAETMRLIRTQKGDNYLVPIEKIFDIDKGQFKKDADFASETNVSELLEVKKLLEGKVRTTTQAVVLERFQFALPPMPKNSTPTE